MFLKGFRYTPTTNREEVLPAAVLRLERHFDLDWTAYVELRRVVAQLRKRQEKGDAFMGIPYDKVKVWADFPLHDKRVKPITDKKVVKTFRLQPAVVEFLKKAAEKEQRTETEILEMALLRAGAWKIR